MATGHPSARAAPSTYAFHGIGLSISADGPLADALTSRLTALPLNGHHPQAVSFHFTQQRAGRSAARPRGNARPVYDPPVGQVLYFDDEDLLYIDYDGRLSVVSRPAAGETQAAVPNPEGHDLWIASHPLFTLPLMESLKRRGLFSIHAAGICVGGRGVLIAGASGSGKSTLSIALSRAGFAFMGDDTLFLSDPRGALRVHAFPDEVDFTDSTARLFPELDVQTRRPGWPKRQVRAERAFGVEIVWRCQPGVLLFPRVTSTPSRLSAMAKRDALLELAPNVLLTERHSSQAHLDIIARLVETCDCYRLDTGPDIEAVPGIIREAFS